MRGRLSDGRAIRVFGDTNGDRHARIASRKHNAAVVRSFLQTCSDGITAGKAREGQVHGHGQCRGSVGDTHDDMRNITVPPKLYLSATWCIGRFWPLDSTPRNSDHTTDVTEDAQDANANATLYAVSTSNASRIHISPCTECCQMAVARPA